MSAAEKFWAELEPRDPSSMSAEERLGLVRCLAIFLDLADDPALWREAAELTSKARIVAVATVEDPEIDP